MLAPHDISAQASNAPFLRPLRAAHTRM